MTDRKPRCDSYIRFSTPEQALGDSERRQVERAERWAAERGMELAPPRMDRGVSAFRGKNVRQGVLAQYLAEIDAGIVLPGDFLIIENIDRLSRQSAYKTITKVVSAIIDRGVGLVTLMPERVYTMESMEGRNGFVALMELGMLIEKAHAESVDKASRLRDAWIGKRRKVREQVLTSVCPGWLRRQGSGFALIPERAEVVRRIFREYLNGVGAQSIVRTLQSEGVPVFGEGMRQGKHWHTTYVRKLLANPAVIGTLEPHTHSETAQGTKRRVKLEGQEVRGYYPAAVDEDTWTRAQALMLGKSPRRGVHASAPVSNVFGGIARCSRCGATVTRVNKGSGATRWEYLVCTKAKAGAGCRYNTVPYAAVEGAFLGDLARVLQSAPLGEDADAAEREIENTRAYMAELAVQYDDAFRAMRSRPSASTAETLRRLERERDELLAELRQQESERELKADRLVSSRIADLEAACTAPELDRSLVNVRMRQVFKAVEVDFDGRALRAEFAHGGWSPPVLFGSPFGDESATTPRPFLASRRK